MKVSVAYTTQIKKCWLKIDVPEQCTAIEAINISGILEQFPEVVIEDRKIGIYGKIIKFDTQINEGDRVEIYRPITADPKTVKRRDTEEDEVEQ